MKVEISDLVSYREIEQETGVAQSTLRTWVSRGKLPKPLREDLGAFWVRSTIVPLVLQRKAEG
jgi:predicted DNA-binding transcriptional regulator AlpA